MYSQLRTPSYKLRTLLIFIFVSVFFQSSFSHHDKKSFGVKKVVIDAGHGGKDPGCKGRKTQEKDVALSIALRLGRYIEDNYTDVTVIYTRRDDKFVELFQRAEIANKNKADLFISIHCNANPSQSAYGVETYVMGLHKSEANLSVAKKENSSILLEDDYKKKYEGFDPNSPESYIIFSLYQNAYLDQSLGLASRVEKSFAYNGRSDRGVKQAGFLVLWKTYMPSMLIETGFLSNPEEEVFLGSEKGQNTIAYSIFKAFKEYKNETEGKMLNVKGSMLNKDSIKHSTLKIKNSSNDTNHKVTISKHEEVKSSKTVDSIQPPSYKPQIPTSNIKPPALRQQPPASIKQTPNSDKGVIFKVQFYISSVQKPSKSKDFKGLTGIDNYFENGSYKYTVGNEKNIDDAKIIQKKVRDIGFKDAFIIAFYDGKKITLSEAFKLIKKNK